jgi:23S rRNA pseudouridine2605 synthase
MTAGAGVRLQKYLSQAGAASRRASEALITGGRVRVNGTVVRELGTRIEPGRDVVELDGQRIEPAAAAWYAVHKPRGVVSTRHDPQGRRTIYDLVPQALHGLFYVGRLDYDSEGLILLTNDGDVAHRMLHPRFGVEREYEVEVQHDIDDGVLAELRRGVELDDGPARAAGVRRTGSRRVRLVLREGRKREVRRMLAACGHDVQRLRRVRYGPVSLGDMAPGSWRELAGDELSALRAAAKRRPR